MADQPGDIPPDARPPDPTKVEWPGGEPLPAAPPPDPTKVERPGSEPLPAAPAPPGSADPTANAPARWSGSAAIPPPKPKRSFLTRRKAQPEEDDWGKTPAVDPWEGQDTPWDPMQIPAAEPVQMPPTRIDAPPPPPPTRIDAPPPPARVEAPPPPPPPSRAPVQPRPSFVPPKYARQAIKKAPEKPLPQQSAPKAPGTPLPPRPAPKAPEKPLPPPRRKRRRLRKLGMFTLLSMAFCCGVPALFLWPAAGQYPVSAVLPDSVSDLDRRDDTASRRAAQRLAAELNDGRAFAGVYGDGNGKRVTIFGTTGLRITPKQDVEAQIRQLSLDYGIREVQSFDMGETGVHERCGAGKSGRSTVVVCAWADHGSLVTVLMTRRSVTDSADLTAVLRSAVLTRG